MQSSTSIIRQNQKQRSRIPHQQKLKNMHHLSLTPVMIVLLSLILQLVNTNAWINNPSTLSKRRTVVEIPYSRYQSPGFVQNVMSPSLSSSLVLFSSSSASDDNAAATASSMTTATTSEIEKVVDDTTDDDDDDEYEYIEYDTLKEEDFVKSEWLVGTCWENNKEKIDETWVRLVYSKDKNIAVWGDGSEGKWSIDVPSQFLSISKENILFGKQIWAGVVQDYYFQQGNVRGWSFLQSASVLAQWQAKRIGLEDRDEAGVAPWFEEQTEEEETTKQLTEQETAEE